MQAAAAPRHSRSAPAQHAALILLLAWLPTLAYVGHWEALAAPASSHAAAHRGGGAPDRAHEQHCHAGFDDCSGGAAAADVLVATVGRDLARVASVLGLAVTLSDATRLSGRSDAPVPPPPRG